MRLSLTFTVAIALTSNFLVPSAAPMEGGLAAKRPRVGQVSSLPRYPRQLPGPAQVTTSTRVHLSPYPAGLCAGIWQRGIHVVS